MDLLKEKENEQTNRIGVLLAGVSGNKKSKYQSNINELNGVVIL